MTAAAAQAMPRVDFYVLAQRGIETRLNFACRLVEKAYKTGSQVYAHTLSAELAKHLDELLWNFRQGSFVPHEVLGEQPVRAPVCIGTAESTLAAGDVLLNLADSTPGFAPDFARIVEIVTADRDVTAAARLRYQQYREIGLSLETHRLGQ